MTEDTVLACCRFREPGTVTDRHEFGLDSHSFGFFPPPLQGQRISHMHLQVESPSPPLRIYFPLHLLLKDMDHLSSDGLELHQTKWDCISITVRIVIKDLVVKMA
uniref:Uncharacterized protein n=1 Tax=Anguilla anguilla TaxID=7936 RepID=A0A0E9S1W9_ANGAN